MRVIAGKFRSRPLQAPPGMDTRPTSDRLRETLFNVLTNGAVDRVRDAVFLDLYAGSGAVGIEAISRGAASVTFVEENSAAIAVLRKNFENLGLRGPAASIEQKTVVRYLRGVPEKPDSRRFDIVFLDPPYDQTAEYELALRLLGDSSSEYLSPHASVIAEHRRKTELSASYGSLVRGRVLLQGDAGLSFYKIAGASDL